MAVGPMIGSLTLTSFILLNVSPMTDIFFVYASKDRLYWALVSNLMSAHGISLSILSLRVNEGLLTCLPTLGGDRTEANDYATYPPPDLKK